MRLLDFLFPERRNTAGIAKDRLKIVLAHERANRDAPDFLAALQKTAPAPRLDLGGPAPWVKPT